MEKQDTILDKIGREANIICGGTIEGAVDEAWKRAQNPASLCGTMAKDVMLAAGTAAVMTVAPEVALPVLGITAAALIIEDRSGRKEAWEKDARLIEACKSAWNDPTKEAAAKNVFASELGQQTFEATIAGLAMVPGFTIGTRFAEGKIARMAEETLASQKMVMSDLGHGTLQPRIGNSLVTTKAEGTVIKQFDNGLLQRHIP